MKRRGEAGQVILLAAVALTALLLAGGLAIDMGYDRYQRRRMQTAADSAAIAAASAIPYCDGGSGCAALTSAGDDDASNNGFTNGSNRTTITVNNPPSSGPNAGDNSYAEVIINQPQPTFFMKIAGILSTNVSTRAVAHLGNGPGCIYALGPSGVGGISGVPMFLTADCPLFSTGALNLPDSSDFLHNRAANGEGSPCQGSGCYASDGTGGGISPYPPQTIIPPADPLAYVPKPSSPGTCPTGQGADTFPNATYPPGSTIPPGLYPCGIVVTGGPMTFNGTYSLGSSGSPATALQIGAATVQSGPDGATFYNTSGAISVNATTDGYSVVQLSAPNSGPYAGILFYQDAADISSAFFGINGGGESSVPVSYLQGALYFPAASIILNGYPYYDPSPVPNSGARYTLLVGYQVIIQGSIVINNDYSPLGPSGSPIKAAVLVE